MKKSSILFLSLSVVGLFLASCDPAPKNSEPERKESASNASQNQLAQQTNLSQENLDETQAKLMAGMDEVEEILGKLPVDHRLGGRRLMSEHGFLTGSNEYYSNYMEAFEKNLAQR
ncbi:MAG: hypothetical protein KDC26_07790 [Armatimonadetes bacterium]|nr:hypothetical protein [Armatimonadota bacterium]